MEEDVRTYTDKELEYAASARCDSCNAGLAHPLNTKDALGLNAWICSEVLKGNASAESHAHYPFAFWKIREESSINNRAMVTTRPPGTVCLTQGEATCPKCGTWWEGQPYDARGATNWFGGSCPTCGYAVGGAGSWRSGEGESISHRYRTIVIDTPTTEIAP